MLQNPHVTAQIGKSPLELQRFLHALKVAGRVVHVRLLYFYVVQAHHGIEFNSVDLGSFANHLPMHLTIGRRMEGHIGAPQ